MIIEVPNYLDLKTIKLVRTRVVPLLKDSEYPTYNREGKTVVISTEPSLQDVDNILLPIFDKIQQEIVAPVFRPLYLSADSGYEYHKYEAGQVCKQHIDRDIVKGILRYATVILYLTTNEQDGELVFPDQGRKIIPQAGKLVVFPPGGIYPHYTESSKYDREILMTWFYYANIRVENAEE